MTDPTVRAFTDRAGTGWTVRYVIPARVERRHASRRTTTPAAPPAGYERRTGADRRVAPQLRVRLPDEYANGWLLLESERGDRHRVVPVPPNWERLSETRLELLARMGSTPATEALESGE